MEESLKRNIRHKIPKGAVMLTREEAYYHQKEMVRNWKPASETWPLRFGCYILSAATGITACYINSRFRRKLRLLDFASALTMAGVVVPSCITSHLFHLELISKKVLLLEITCPVCFESKAAMFQCITGVFLPLLATPLSNFTVTAGSGVYNTPHITDWRRIIKVLRSAYQPMIPQLTLIFTLHALLAGFITYSEVKSYLYIQDAQYLLEEE